MLGVPHAWFWLLLLSNRAHGKDACRFSWTPCISSIDALIHAFYSSTPPFQASLHWLFHDVYQNPYGVPSF